MHIQAFIFAQKEITKGRTAIVFAVMVVLRASTRHQRYADFGKDIL
jgi:hypothetical protein